jgi:hypothetical protein
MATACIEPGTRVRMLGQVLEFGRDLGELADVRHGELDAAGLARRFARDGYLLIRGLHPPERVAAARSDIAAGMERAGLLDPGRSREELAIGPANRSRFFSQQEIAGLTAYLDLVTAPALMEVVAALVGPAPQAFRYRWLRCLARAASCGIHYDRVYMARSTTRIVTCWTPLHDLPLECGPLVLCLGSRDFAELRSSYGAIDADRDQDEGILKASPAEVVRRHGGRWATATFREGDVLLFGMYMLHGALPNESGRYRVTSDTRYQPAGEPLDPRFA